jgi:hypothetical protein
MKTIYGSNQWKRSLEQLANGTYQAVVNINGIKETVRFQLAH